MKNTIFKFVAVFLLFFLSGCRTEIETEKDKIGLNSIENKISFSRFKKETGVKNFKYTIKSSVQNSSNLSRGNGVLSLFNIDTLNINRLNFDKKLTYSFRAYNIFQSPEKKYNVVYFYKNSKWNYSLLELLDNNKTKPLYDSRYGDITIAENSATGRMCLMAYTSYSYHCTHTGSCASGVCDGCNLCITENSGYVYVDCGGSNGGGDATGTGDLGSSGGSGTSLTDPSGYIFDSSLPPTIDPEYVRAARAYNFWQQLSGIGNGALQWSSEHPDLYSNVIENYLNNYSTTNNTQNLQFHNWAIQFLMENSTNGISDVSWAQFHNWFINEDGTSNLTFDNSLNGTNSKVLNMQEFINFLNNDVNISTYQNSTSYDNSPQRTVRSMINRMGIFNTGIDINVKLEKINNLWTFDSVTSEEFIGVAFSYSWSQKSFQNNIVNNSIVVEVFGYEKMNLFIEGVGTIYKNYGKVIIKINPQTGLIISSLFVDLPG